MANYLKPQTPMNIQNDYFYPITTADQILRSDGTRLEQNGKVVADLTVLSNKPVNVVGGIWYE